MTTASDNPEKKVVSFVRSVGAVNWFRALMALLLFTGNLLTVCGMLWLKANYVPQEANKAAWQKQVEINEKLTATTQTLQVTVARHAEKHTQHDFNIRSLKQDIREQRRILNIPNQ